MTKAGRLGLVVGMCMAVLAACAAPMGEDVAASAEGLEREDECLALADPELDARSLDRLAAAYPDCADAVQTARRRDAASGEPERIMSLTDGGDPVFYDCGILTCTCYNTMDCLAMAWETTDGPCVNNGSGGKTCCIDAC